MRKFIYLFLLFTISLNSQTILDYGAIQYNSKEEALSGKQSAHTAMQAMLDDVDKVVLPSFGWFYMGDTVILWAERESVVSLGGENKGIYLVTDKPISMFLPIANFISIKGFTAVYTGENITEECAVVRLGGDERNLGGDYVNHLGTLMKHFRPRRTNSLSYDIDFDMIGGDLKYMQPSSSDYNPNYGAHGVWINYDEENESTHSHFHYSTIRGHYYSVHTAIKIKKRVPTQSLNTFDINLRVRGAKMFYDIDGVNFGKLVIRGQGLYMGYAEDPLFSLKNSGRIMYDVFVYDEGRKGYIEDCTDIQLIGWSKIHRYLIGEVPGLAKTMFVNTTFKDNNDVIQYTNRLPQEVIDNLKEALDK